MFRYLPLILRNCWRNRRRTTLTVLSIAVSMCLLGVLIALYHAFYLSAPAPDEALRLVVRNRISLTVPIPEFYGARIRQVPGVREVMMWNWFGGVYKDSRDPKNLFARVAVEPGKLFRIYGEFRMPEDQKQAFVLERTGGLIGRDLADKFNFHLGDRINLVGDIFPGDYEFTVRGIFDSPRASDVMFINRDYLEQTLPEGRRGQVATFYVLLDRPESGGARSGRRGRGVSQRHRADQDGIRASLRRGVPVDAGKREDAVDRHIRRRDVHHPAGFGQHHGDGGPRTRARSRRPEDAGFHAGHRPGPDPRGGGHDLDRRRGDRLPDLDRADRGHPEKPVRRISAARRIVSAPRGRGVRARRRRHRAREFARARDGCVAHFDRRRTAERGLAMAIPIAYNLRNLVVRKTTTIMTALGIALTVAVLLAILALMDGLRTTLTASGDPLNVLALRKGSDSELSSNFTRTQFQDLKFRRGIASGHDGQPLASLEVVTVVNLANVDNPDGANVTNAMPETEYYELQTAQAAPVEYTGIFVSIIMAVGSSFAAMNTMYAAVSRRAREIGTLRVLGFSQASILLSFFVESVLLSAVGGLLGCLLVLPLNGITTGIGNSNFSETAFRFHVTPGSFLAGVAFAVVLGAVGGFFPARNAANKEILTALREV
ncbi:MAG: ABC transporter permease [Acidobacteriia bacterium]|nr:ABC transporter permease [Terriglobia bacterium]